MGFRSSPAVCYRHEPHSASIVFAVVKEQPPAIVLPEGGRSPCGTPPRSPINAVPSAPAPLPSYLVNRRSPPTSPTSYDAPAIPVEALHKNLRGTVNFAPYPTVPFFLPPAYLPKEAMARVFIGQLPYDVTDMQLQWLCYTFGNATPIYFPERITRHSTEHKGEKIPTGCVHAYVDPTQVDALFAGLNERLLIDDPGVWFADSAAQQLVLERYCEALKSDRKHRASRRPHDMVVAQIARSTFVPRPPSYRSFHKQHVPVYQA